MASSFLRFLDHIRHTTVGRKPLDEWSARRRDLYLTTTLHWAMTSSFLRFLDHIRHTTVGKTPLDEWSVRCRDLYLTTVLQWTRVSSYFRFLDHIRHTTVGRTPLDEWSARRRDLYVRTQKKSQRQTSMLPLGFSFICFWWSHIPVQYLTTQGLIRPTRPIRSFQEM